MGDKFANEIERQKMLGSRGGICDNRCQSFSKEIIENEERLRTRWFLKNREKLVANVGGERVLREAKLRATGPEARGQRGGCRAGNLPSWKPPKMNEPVELEAMRPVDERTRAILYRDKVKSFVNAEDYLYCRRRKAPEDRYYFPDCTNWLYGWRLSDFPPIPASSLGRKQVLRAEMYHPREYNLRGESRWERGCQAVEAKDFRQWML